MRFCVPVGFGIGPQGTALFAADAEALGAGSGGGRDADGTGVRSGGVASEVAAGASVGGWMAMGGRASVESVGGAEFVLVPGSRCMLEAMRSVIASAPPMASMMAPARIGEVRRIGTADEV